MTSGLYVVDREYFRKLARRLGRSIASSGDSLSSRMAYRGFDGGPWPAKLDQIVHIRGGVAPLKNYWKIVASLQNETASGYDILWLGSLPQWSTSFSFHFLGYDLGYYDQGHFSSIYHEVIPNRYPELGPFRAALNENLLLPNPELANRLRKARIEMIGAGIDLEQAGTCHVVRVSAMSATK